MNFLQVLQENFDSLSAVLVWVAGAGGMVLFGVIKARVLENWVAWHNFPVWIKKSAPMLVAGIFAMIANLSLDFGIIGYIPDAVATFLLFGINYLAGSVTHQNIKDSTFGASARATAETYLG